MSDYNYESHADVDVVLVSDRTIPVEGIIASVYSDILKLSKATNVVVTRCTIQGGAEDCIDMNRYCENVDVTGCILLPNGNNGITIKGGTKNVHIKDVTFVRHGKDCDIDLGNWSDQSNELTTGVVLENVTSTDGKPVRCRVLWADVPTVIGGNVKLVVYPRWIVKIYRFLRARKLVP